MGFTPFNGGLETILAVVSSVMAIGLVLVFGVTIIIILNGGIKPKNNAPPVHTVCAKVVVKRMAFILQQKQGNNRAKNSHSLTTTYFTTFEIENHDRIEFKISDTEYGMLVEGDTGELTFEGTNYNGFKRVDGKKT